MAAQPVNELLSTQKSSDGLQITLHPLPILEISDHIIRSYQRGHKGAIVGALLGQQNGRAITIEHSFSAGATFQSRELKYELERESFSARLEQLKAVHKTPAMDLVGWYSLVPKTGPTPDHLPIHEQILSLYNDSAILLGFHTHDAVNQVAGNNPLPLTIYESNFEAEDPSKETHPQGEDREMKDSEAPPNMVLRFRELPYTTETGEAEMIAMQFVREGVAPATLDVPSSSSKKAAKTDKKGKGKQVATSQFDESQVQEDDDAILSKDELEQISALQTKANAIKMMKDRIELVIAYLERLPPEFANGSRQTRSTSDHLPPSLNILRQIQALVTNIELVTPAQQEALEKEMVKETNDVHLVSLYKDIFSSMMAIRDVGKKFAVVEAAKNQKPRTLASQQSYSQYGAEYSQSQQASLGNVGDIHLL